MPVQSPSVSAPLFRILDPEVAEEQARNRQAWADLWRAIAREAGTDRSDQPRDDDEEPAESAA
jgi:hypothetical protein